MLSERQFCEAIDREGNFFFLEGIPSTTSSFMTFNVNTGLVEF
jgi:hypothetical protein